MLVYLLVACDRLDEKQEKKLKRNLPDLQAALQAYVDENEAGNVTLINDCESDADPPGFLSMTMKIGASWSRLL